MNTVPPSGFKWLRAPDWAESNLGHLSWRGGGARGGPWRKASPVINLRGARKSGSGEPAGRCARGKLIAGQSARRN